MRATGGGSPVLFRTLGGGPVTVRRAMVPTAPVHAYQLPPRTAPNRTGPVPHGTTCRTRTPTLGGLDWYETPIPAHARGVVSSKPDPLEVP